MLLKNSDFQKFLFPQKTRKTLLSLSFCINELYCKRLKMAANKRYHRISLILALQKSELSVFRYNQ